MPRVSAEHMDSRRRQILAAATRCFARVGFHAATMQDIIKEAGLSAGAIYNYYASKEDIIVAIAEARHAREREIFAAAADADGADGLIASLVQGFAHQLSDVDERRERRVGVQLWAEALNNKRLLAVTREGTDEPRRALSGLFDRMKAEGRVPPGIDSDALARTFIALFEGLVLQKCREEELPLDAYGRAVLFLWQRLSGDLPSLGQTLTAG